MESTAFDEIADAIWRLRAAFIKNGMKPPVSIELGTAQDGYVFNHLMPRDMVLSQPRMGVERDDPEWVCNIMGVEVRRPAEWRCVRGGTKILHEPRLYSMDDLNGRLEE